MQREVGGPTSPEAVHRELHGVSAYDSKVVNQEPINLVWHGDAVKGAIDVGAQFGCGD